MSDQVNSEEQGALNQNTKSTTLGLPRASSFLPIAAAIGTMLFSTSTSQAVDETIYAKLAREAERFPALIQEVHKELIYQQIISQLPVFEDEEFQVTFYTDFFNKISTTDDERAYGIFCASLNRLGAKHFNISSVLNIGNRRQLGILLEEFLDFSTFSSPKGEATINGFIKSPESFKMNIYPNTQIASMALENTMFGYYEEIPTEDFLLRNNGHFEAQITGSTANFEEKLALSPSAIESFYEHIQDDMNGGTNGAFLSTLLGDMYIVAENKADFLSEYPLDLNNVTLEDISATVNLVIQRSSLHIELVRDEG